MDLKNTTSSTETRTRPQISKNRRKNSSSTTKNEAFKNYKKTSVEETQFNDKFKSKSSLLKKSEDIHYGDDTDDLNKGSISTETFQDSTISDGIKDVHRNFQELNARSGGLPEANLEIEKTLNSSALKDNLCIKTNQSEPICMSAQAQYEKGRENVLYRNLNVVLNTKNLLSSASAQLRRRKKKEPENTQNLKNKVLKISESDTLSNNLEDNSLESIQKKILNKLNKEKVPKHSHLETQNEINSATYSKKFDESYIDDNHTEGRSERQYVRSESRPKLHKLVEMDNNYLTEVQKKLKKGNSSPSQGGDKSTDVSAQQVDDFPNEDWGQYPNSGEHNTRYFSQNRSKVMEFDLLSLDPIMSHKPNYQDPYFNGFELEPLGNNFNTEFNARKTFHDIPELELYDFECDRKLIEFDQGLGSGVNQEVSYENFLYFNEDEPEKMQRELFSPIETSPFIQHTKNFENEALNEQFGLCNEQDTASQESAVKSEHNKTGAEAVRSTRFETLLSNIKTLEMLFDKTKQELSSLRNHYSMK